jgi:ligand-binding SRPBCC domain-containing protein
MAHFEAEQWLPVPLPQVFALFSDPTNLPHIMPAAMQVRIESSRLVAPPSGSGEIFQALQLNKVAGAGSEFVFSVRPLPYFFLRMEWHARIEEWEPGNYFLDTQLSGPMHRWSHRHEFRAERREGRDGTLIRDLIDFEVGYGWAGRLLERIFVLPSMRKSFTHRQQQVEQSLRSV